MGGTPKRIEPSLLCRQPALRQRVGRREMLKWVGLLDRRPLARRLAQPSALLIHILDLLRPSGLTPHACCPINTSSQPLLAGQVEADRPAPSPNLLRLSLPFWP